MYPHMYHILKEYFFLLLFAQWTDKLKKKIFAISIDIQKRGLLLYYIYFFVIGSVFKYRPHIDIHYERFIQFFQI